MNHKAFPIAITLFSAGVTLWGDMLFGHWFPFYFLLVVPVLIGARVCGRGIALSLALTLPLAHAIILVSHGRMILPLVHLILSGVLHTLILIMVVELVHRLRAKNNEALQQIKILRGMLPICASCKDIRDDSGYWKRIEEYITQHAEVEFSHGMCPDCMLKLYPEYAGRLSAKRPEPAIRAESPSL